MHVHLAQVIRDLRGVTGLAMRRALLAGARDPARRAAFNDDRSQASPHTLANRLEGHGRDAGLFIGVRHASATPVTRRTSPRATPRSRPTASPVTGRSRAQPRLGPPRRVGRRTPDATSRTLSYTPRSRLSGVDLTRIDGLEGLTAHTLMAESGLEMSRWQRDTPVTSWRGFCPDHRISGGTGLTRRTRDVVHRAADALRLAAQHQRHSTSARGAHERRLRARLGAPQALTAMAHTRARLVYRLRTCGQPYVDTGREHDDARFRQQRLQWLPRQAREVNLHLVPNQPVPSPVS